MEFKFKQSQSENKNLRHELTLANEKISKVERQFEYFKTQTEQARKIAEGTQSNVSSSVSSTEDSYRAFRKIITALDISIPKSMQIIDSQNQAHEKLENRSESVAGSEHIIDTILKKNRRI